MVWITCCVCFYHSLRDENELQPSPQLKLEISKPQTSFMSSLLRNGISCFWYHWNCNSHSANPATDLSAPFKQAHLSCYPTPLPLLQVKSSSNSWELKQTPFVKMNRDLLTMQNVCKCQFCHPTELMRLDLVPLIMKSKKQNGGL